jgi:hypothetical protein
MHELQLLLVARGLAPPLSRPKRLTDLLSAATDMAVYPQSLTGLDQVIYFVARSPYSKHLGLAYNAAHPPPGVEDFEGTVETRDLEGVRVALKLCPCSHANAVAIRRRLPFTAPQCLGLAPSFGLGDRLGLATPGHIAAVRGSGLRPVFAQQSIREMSRTGRSPEQVLDDATWGVLQQGFRDGFGADADHLKTAGDVDACVAAGFTLFTIDPGALVDSSADMASAGEVAEKFRRLPWDTLESSPTDCRVAYLCRSLPAWGDERGDLTEEQLLRAAVKYGAAIAHAARLYRHLAARKGAEPFEFEISVDETATPTSAFEHYFVAGELSRLGVRWVSLAPRFVGEFEKGVDFKGDLAAFERSFAQHAAIARALGPYKLSIHSGSDKFAIYPIAARLAGGLIHVKTAGTSYVEALHAIAMVDSELLREILDFAREHYEADRASYSVSADLARVPRAAALKKTQIPHLFEDPDARQVFHVTYGSVLGARNADGSYRFRERLLNALHDHEELYARFLERHLGRHIAPFRKG